MWKKGVHSGINMILRGKNEPELSIDDLLVMLFDEVEYVWPKLGYPPLVTPFSQYVKNVALMNLMQLVKGERWTMRRTAHRERRRKSVEYNA